MTPEAYATWRKTIPWTDEQIAAVFDARALKDDAAGRAREAQVTRDVAAFVRKGCLTSGIVKTVAHDLVKLCTICGRPAIFRWGTSGRCRQHKYDKPGFIVARHARIEAMASAIEREQNHSDSVYKKRHSLHECAR